MMKPIGWMAALAFLAAGSTASAESLIALVEIHDFKQGPRIIRETLAKAWVDGESFHFESGTCSASSSFSENDGHKDRQPISISTIQHLGKKSWNTRPAYLVSGFRALWIEHASPSPLYVEVPCTWLIVFSGNRIVSVREATELHYLIDES